MIDIADVITVGWCIMAWLYVAVILGILAGAAVVCLLVIL